MIVSYGLFLSYNQSVIPLKPFMYIMFILCIYVRTKTNSKTKDLISLKRVKYIDGFKVRTCNKTNLSTLFC